MLQSPDFKELLKLLERHDVRYLVVGGYAVMLCSEPRWTKDLDLWIALDLPNARAVFRALREFGAPLAHLTEEDFATPGYFYQMGNPPLRVDVMMGIPGGDFDAAWTRRNTIRLGDCQFLNNSDGPFDAEEVHLRRVAETEVGHQGLVAVASCDQSQLPHGLSADGRRGEDLCAHRKLVRRHTLQLHSKPVAGVAVVQLQKVHASSDVRHKQVQESVGVEVNPAPSCGVVARVAHGTASEDLLEVAVAQVSPQAVPLPLNK